MTAIRLERKSSEGTLEPRISVSFGEYGFLDRDIDLTSEQDFIRLRDDYVSASGQRLNQVEYELWDAILPERMRWLAERNPVEAGKDAASSPPPPSKNLRDDWADFQNRLQLYRGRNMLGLPTGMETLDDRTLGLRGLILLGAMPNVGKTALTQQLGLGVIRNNPDSCFLLVSLEMGRRDLYTRIYCNLAGMDYKKLMFGNKDKQASGSFFTQDEQARLDSADKWVQQNGHRIRILDRETFPDVNAENILAAVNQLKAETNMARALIVIDYLQLITVPQTVARSGDLEADKYRVRVAQDVAADTKSATNPIGDAVLAISEARKPSGEKRAWGTGMADLMGSARLGYAADAVLLYRRMNDTEFEKYEFQTARPGVDQKLLEARGIAPIVLSLAKGRDGMRIGEWGVEYYFNQSIFREVKERTTMARETFPEPGDFEERVKRMGPTDLSSMLDAADDED